MITKIELPKPESMSESEIESELKQRLHDLELAYASESPDGDGVQMLREAQRLIHVGDRYQAELKVMPVLREQSRHSEERSRENAERIISLFAFVNQDSDKMSSALATNEQFELIEAEVVDEFGLSQSQIDRLTQLEFAIQRGIEGFVALGEALIEIRDSGLYKAYGTFEAYCEKKWKFSKSRAYQLIDGSKIVNNLLTSGIDPEQLPKNEAQTRALSSVPVDKQAQVWSEAREGGKPSAGKIKAIAKGDSAVSDRVKVKISDGSSEVAQQVADGFQGLLHKQDESEQTIEINGKLMTIKEAKALEKALKKAFVGLDEPEVDETWNSNLWETPTNIARQIAHLLNHDEGKILECAIGTGQIAQELLVYANVVSLTGVEILKDRADRARNRSSLRNCKILNQDFLQMTPKRSFDAVVTNPPFEWGMDFIHHSLKFIKPEGRLLFVLPIAFFCAKERGFRFQGMDAHIHKVYPVIGRIPYLKEGVAETGRQCDDAIFDIRLGKDGACMEFICQ